MPLGKMKSSVRLSLEFPNNPLGRPLNWLGILTATSSIFTPSVMDNEMAGHRKKPEGTGEHNVTQSAFTNLSLIFSSEGKYTQTHTCARAHTPACMHVHTHTRTHTYACTHACTCAHRHTLMHTHIHTYTHSHTHRHTHAHTHTHTHTHILTRTHTDTHTHTHIHIHTHTHQTKTAIKYNAKQQQISLHTYTLTYMLRNTPVENGGNDEGSSPLH